MVSLLHYTTNGWFTPLYYVPMVGFTLVSPSLCLCCVSVVCVQLSPEQTPMWEPSPEPFTVEVRDPEKKKKFKGMKSFTAYRVVPSVSEMRKGGREGGGNSEGEGRGR